MKRSLFIYFFGIGLGLSVSLSGQSPFHHKIDSLRNEIKTGMQAFDLADIYYQITDLYYYCNHDSALYYSHLYLEASLESEDLEWIAYGYYMLTDLFYTSDHDSAEYYGKLYLDYSRQMDDTLWIADAHSYLGYIYDQKGDLEEALGQYREALAGFRKIKDTIQAASCLNNIGYIISYGTDQPAGLSYFLQALQLAELVNDSVLISDASTNIAYYYDRLKDYTTAKVYYTRSLEFDLKIGDSLAIALSQANMANLEYVLGNHDRAFTHIEISKKHISGSHAPFDLAFLYSSYIDFYLETVLSDSVARYIDLVEAILSVHDLKIQEAYLCMQKGFLEFRLNRYRACVDYLNDCSERFHSLGYLEALPEVYSKQAEAYAALGLHREAFLALNRSTIARDSLRYGSVAALLSRQEQDRYYKMELRNRQLEMDLQRTVMETSMLRLRLILIIAGTAGFLVLCLLLLTAYYHLRLRRKNIQLEINQEKLRVSEKELQDLNATKDKFFSIIAHDLKSPLSTIIGISDLFMQKKDSLDPETILPLAENMHTTANYGYAMLDNLLQWAMSQTGKILPNPEEVFIDQIVSGLVIDFKGMAANKSLVIQVSTDNPPAVNADMNMTASILRNLLHNAIKFSHENGRIEIYFAVEDTSLVTSVKDQGVGMPEKDMATLFSLDKQTSRSGTANEKGSGLGLILCKEFVEKNKGRIWVECREKEGCTFSFSLPLFT